ncbi:hypothetical protein [Sulfitobacter sp. 1A12779]|uniref:hypothetical protein n=1 Tax=Sulfitobacter sp. 1A12779 TaxID=3368599 RepID=UPI0037469C8F
MLDLHDGIGGQLVNTLAYMENSDHNDPVLQNAIVDALRDMGLMIDSLSLQDDIPVMLGRIRTRLEPLLVRHSAQFEWKVDGETRLDDQTPSDVLALMCIVQEAITNAVKHSRAAVVTVASEDRSIMHIRQNAQELRAGTKTARVCSHSSNREAESEIHLGLVRPRPMSRHRQDFLQRHRFSRHLPTQRRQSACAAVCPIRRREGNPVI